MPQGTVKIDPLGKGKINCIYCLTSFFIARDQNSPAGRINLIKQRRNVNKKYM